MTVANEEHGETEPGPAQRKRPGRRPGGADTRGTVLDAARARFAAAGYEKTSVRAVARAAGVDPALVHHYFGTKEKLFLAALDFPLEPSVIGQLIAGGERAEAGERIVRFALSLWDQPPVRERLLAMLRTAATNEQVAELFRGFVSRALVGQVAKALGSQRADLRVELVMAQVVGLAMARYVFRIEPLASAGTEDLVRLVGPVFQHYLDAPLAESD